MALSQCPTMENMDRAGATSASLHVRSRSVDLSPQRGEFRQEVSYLVTFPALQSTPLRTSGLKV